jgi:hypothetical protein
MFSKRGFAPNCIVRFAVEIMGAVQAAKMRRVFYAKKAPESYCRDRSEVLN